MPIVDQPLGVDRDEIEDDSQRFVLANEPCDETLIALKTGPPTLVASWPAS
jgi:hypothetical protein